jgi:hypothetical protein
MDFSETAVKVYTALNWFRQDSVNSFCEYGYEILGSIKGRGNFLLSDQGEILHHVVN